MLSEKEISPSLSLWTSFEATAALNLVLLNNIEKNQYDVNNIVFLPVRKQQFIYFQSILFLLKIL